MKYQNNDGDMYSSKGSKYKELDSFKKGSYRRWFINVFCILDSLIYKYWLLKNYLYQYSFNHKWISWGA